MTNMSQVGGGQKKMTKQSQQEQPLEGGYSN